MIKKSSISAGGAMPKTTCITCQELGIMTAKEKMVNGLYRTAKTTVFVPILISPSKVVFS
jgi:hypothetical protein